MSWPLRKYETKRQNSHLLIQRLYTCQLSRLRVENFDLTPAHACGPISHAWLKNVSCRRRAWHNFQKHVNSDQCKERKPCVKWINDNTFLAISDFWSEKHWERARVYTRPKTGTGITSITSPLADFGRLQKTSDFFGNLRKWSCRLQKSQNSSRWTFETISATICNLPGNVPNNYYFWGFEFDLHKALDFAFRQQPQPSWATSMHNMDALIKLPGIVSGNRFPIIYKIAFVWNSTPESLVFTVFTCITTQWAHPAHEIHHTYAH